MFSLHARERLLKRGWSAASFLGFFRDSVRESRDNARAQPQFTRAIARFGLICSILIPLGLLPIYWPAPYRGYLLCAGLTVAAIATITSWCLLYVGLIRRDNGTVPGALGVANYLTLLRFYFIVPVVALLLQGRMASALILYLVLGLTDILDGAIARRRGEQTEFGTVMDPLADVFSTAAIFTALWALDLIPGWLLALLLVRYVMLMLGSFLFFLLVGPLRFRATVPGKIVGVLQAVGVTAIVLSLLFGPKHLERVGPVLFPFLGLCFASIVVSQAVIAVAQWRRLRSTRGKA